MIDTHEESVDGLAIDDVDIDDPAIESLLVGRKVKVLLQDVDRERWRQDLIEDRTRLATWLSAAWAFTHQRAAKPAAIQELYAHKVAAPINVENANLPLFKALHHKESTTFHTIS